MTGAAKIKSTSIFVWIYISSDEVFSAKKPEINDTSYESQADFDWEKPNNQTPKMSFSASANQYLFIQCSMSLV